MSSAAGISPPARTWRDIHQDIAPRAMSREGRKRMAMATFKSISLVVLLGASAWAGYEVLRLWETDPTKLRALTKSEPVGDRIALRTDGVLDKAAVLRMLAMPKTAGLMELDLFALRDRLLADPQVRTAVLEKNFKVPATLSVVLEERFPVARILVQSGDGQPVPHLVARDGVVFAGNGFPDELANQLPYLDGVKLKRVGKNFAPIEGMDTVASLLGQARSEIPAIYATWRVVSLAKLATDGVLIVNSTTVPEIIFGTRDEFHKLIAQLDVILDTAREHPEWDPLRSINLAVGGAQAPVAFLPPPPPPVSGETKPKSAAASVSSTSASSRTAVPPARGVVPQVRASLPASRTVVPASRTVAPQKQMAAPARAHPLRPTAQRVPVTARPQRLSPL